MWTGPHITQWLWRQGARRFLPNYSPKMGPGSVRYLAFFASMTNSGGHRPAEHDLSNRNRNRNRSGLQLSNRRGHICLDWQSAKGHSLLSRKLNDYLLNPKNPDRDAPNNANAARSMPPPCVRHTRQRSPNGTEDAVGHRRWPHP